MNYGEILREAFRITWRNKFLWFFGFFVGGAGGSFNFPSGGGGNIGGSVPSDFSGLGRAISENLFLIIGIVAFVALVLFVVFLALSLISDAALAESVAAIDRGEGRRFGVAWRAGSSFLWRVLGLRISLALIGLALLILLGIVIGAPIVIVLVATQSTAARVIVISIAALVGIALLILLFVPLAVIGQWALRRAVVENAPIFASISDGYRLFRRNIGRSLLLWLLQLGVMLGVGIAFLIVAVIVALPLAIPVILLATAGYTTAAVMVGIVVALVFLAVVLPLSGAVGTFKHSYWTLSYLRLVGTYGDSSAPRVR